MGKKIKAKLPNTDIFSVEEFCCDVCDQYEAVVKCDNSSGEYGSIYICQSCLNQLFLIFKDLKELE